MKLSEFNYELPEELIAQVPLENRDESRLLILNRKTGEIKHSNFRDVINYLKPGDCLVRNNTKVIPARLYGYKDTGAKIEVFLLKEHENKEWEVLIKPSKRVKEGTVVKIADELSAEVIKPLHDDGKWLVRMVYEGDILDILHRVGNIPLPIRTLLY